MHMISCEIDEMVCEYMYEKWGASLIDAKRVRDAAGGRQQQPAHLQVAPFGSSLQTHPPLHQVVS